MVRTYIFGLLVILSCLLPPGIFAVPSVFYQFSLREGLPDNRIYQISEDSSGHIWLATAGGLVKLYGAFPEVFTVAEGLPRNDIRAVVHRPDGSAWIVSSGQLAIMSPAHSFSLATYPKLRDQRVFDAHLDAEGVLWCLGAEQLFAIISDENVQAWTFDELGLAPDSRMDHTWKTSGIAISSNQSQILLQPNGEASNLPGKSIPRGDSLLITLNGYAQTQISVFSRHIRFSLGGQQVSVPLTDEGNTQFSAAFRDHAGNLWLATNNSGALMLSHRYQVNIRAAFQLGSQYQHRIEGTVTAIARMNDDLLVAASDGRILRLDASEKTSWRLPDGQPAEDLIGHQDRWIARRGDRLYFGTPGSDNVLTTRVEGLSQIHEAGNRGIVLSAFSRFHYMLPWDQCDSLFRSDNPDQWLEQQTDWVQVGFSNQAIQTSSGAFAVALDEGITFPKQTGNQDLTMEYPFYQGEYTDLSLWAGETIVAGAGPDGIHIFEKGQKIFPADGQDPWTYGRVKRVITDATSGHIWVLTNLGLVRFDSLPQAGRPYTGYLISDHQGFPHTFVDGWVVMDERQTCILTSGRIYPLKAPLPQDLVDADIPLTVYCLMWPGSRCIPLWEGRRVIPRDSASMNLQLVVDHYQFIDNQRLEYRIQDEDWMPAPNGVISFFAMPSGEYALDARVKVGQHVLLQQNDILKWAVQPPFYQSWWFVFLSSIMLVALIWAGLNLYYGEHERRKLGALVNERTRSLDDSIKELERKNEDLEQFAYIASHDLKSPLRGMIGHLQLIQRRYAGQLNEQGNSSLVHAISEAKRLFAMVNDLLDFASVGSEKMDKKQISLQKLVESVKHSMIVEIKEKQAEIISNDLPVAEIVPSQWEALFRNLIENGIKFNESPRPVIRIEHKSTEGFWIFKVADNGIGIDPQYVKRAFELYGRLHPEYPGTGIGLAICKRVVERHGGSIWIESKIGEGSAFFFSLPK